MPNQNDSRTLTDFQWDEQLRLVVRVDKTWVDVKKVVSLETGAIVDSAIGLTESTMREYKGQNINQAIRIDSTPVIAGKGEVGLNDAAASALPIKRVYSIDSVQVAFPDTLLSAGYVWAYASETPPDGAQRMEYDVGLQTRIKSGYSGMCEARMTEILTYDLTDAAIIALVPVVTKFFPESQHITGWWLFASEAQVTARVNNFFVPKTLHAQIVLSNGGGPTTADTIQATTPTALPTTGTWVPHEVFPPERHALGIWILRWIEVKMP